MSRSNIIILILSICCGVLLFFYFNGQRYDNIKDDQIEALQKQRDSIIGHDMEQSILKEISHKNAIDSLVDYSKVYIKADSINKITIQNEKAKLRLLTKSALNRVRDSILSANHIQVGTR